MPFFYLVSLVFFCSCSIVATEKKHQEIVDQDDADRAKVLESLRNGRPETTAIDIPKKAAQARRQQRGAVAKPARQPRGTNTSNRY